MYYLHILIFGLEFIIFFGLVINAFVFGFSSWKVWANVEIIIISVYAIIDISNLNNIYYAISLVTILFE